MSHSPFSRYWLYLLPIIFSATLSASSQTPRPAPCPASCVEIMDFQSNDTPLRYSRSITLFPQDRNGLAPHWRHGYELRLTADGDDRVLFDQHGQEHRFRLQENGGFAAVHARSGSLSRRHNVHYWTDEAGIETEFQGSYPTRMHFPDQQSLRLDYVDGRLQSISDERGSRIVIAPLEEGVSRIMLPDGRTLDVVDDSCPPGAGNDADATDQCDTQASPVPGFAGLTVPPGVLALDARPASCRSYFEQYYGTRRGEEIESAIAVLPPYAGMLPANRSFPIIDFINGEQLLVVRSRDLASPSFNDPENPDALYERLLRDGSQIQSRFLEPLQRNGAVTTTEQGRTTHIRYHPAQSVSLHVVIRQHMAGPEHWLQLERARGALRQRHGIELQVVVIP